MIDGLVEGGIGVDLPTEAFDIACDLADIAALRALEEHMLVKMGEPFFPGPLVGGADSGPDLELDHGCAVALAKEKSQSVG